MRMNFSRTHMLLIVPSILICILLVFTFTPSRSIPKLTDASSVEIGAGVRTAAFGHSLLNVFSPSKSDTVTDSSEAASESISGSFMSSTDFMHMVSDLDADLRLITPNMTALAAAFARRWAQENSSYELPPHAEQGALCLLPTNGRWGNAVQDFIFAIAFARKHRMKLYIDSSLHRGFEMMRLPSMFNNVTRRAGGCPCSFDRTKTDSTGTIKLVFTSNHMGSNDIAYFNMTQPSPETDTPSVPKWMYTPPGELSIKDSNEGQVIYSNGMHEHVRKSILEFMPPDGAPQPQPTQCIVLTGYMHTHTKLLHAQHRQLIQQAMKPVPVFDMLIDVLFRQLQKIALQKAIVEYRTRRLQIESGTAVPPMTVGPLVGIHIRRGDYEDSSAVNKDMRRIPMKWHHEFLQTVQREVADFKRRQRTDLRASPPWGDKRPIIRFDAAISQVIDEHSMIDLQSDMQLTNTPKGQMSVSPFSAAFDVPSPLAVDQTDDSLPPLTLFIASDELPIVHRYFGKRGFIDALDSMQLFRLAWAESQRDMSIILQKLKLGFNMQLNDDESNQEFVQAQLFKKFGSLIDWYMMGRMDRLGIAASTFSHTASLLSRDSQAQFWMPSKYKLQMVPFNPWNAEQGTSYKGVNSTRLIGEPEEYQ